MTFATAEPRRWPAVRWLAAILLVCAAQVGLVRLLEDRSPVVPRKPDTAPAIRLSGGQPGGWFALTDPTLFVLPHLQGFSGEGWLKIRALTFPTAEWTELATNLQLSVQQLGVGFNTFLASAAFPTFQPLVMPTPELRLPEVNWALPVSTRSTLRIEGDLAKRRLLSLPELPVWTNGELADLTTDFLTNSVVQLLVDAQGCPVSAVLLTRVSSGSAIVDHLALDLAKAARFEPVNTGGVAANPLAGLTIGTLLFEWQTMLMRSTNAPAGTP